MVLEAAELYVLPGKETDFERDFKIAGRFISSVPGYIKHSLQRCLEQSGKYLLLVEWERMEDHTIGFRQSEVYEPWKELLHHYYDPFPVVEHFVAVDI
ncbi:antibiotic biosynthesis monooxygenase family protein [Mucilaginibacter auburnensis]|uniref:Heme-degrading monooxygenase HmoA n=1 Tax=Mucilaginibacter auburnensis TaxID=1457233 RepID=A0A2H9VL53_9SPHI|nr:antibiotic biosynthesis monooxygenase [Mucilaginibacter auburnensis]PJJ79015.1 heme-degrading monooxygenase HmoA [Mucilaginibacter auburnensis]